MGTTVAPARRWRRKREPARWAQALAADVGLAPATIEWQVHRGARAIQHVVARILLQLRTTDADLYAKVAAPIEAAMRGVAAQPLTSDLICEAQEADAAEELAESAYLATRTVEALREWRRRVEVQRATSLHLYLALCEAEAAR